MKTPKYRENGDGRAFAVYPNSGGRREYFGRFGTPEAEQKYLAWLSDLIAAMAAGEPVARDRKPGRTLGDLSLDYLTWADAYYGASRERLNVRDTICLLVEFCGELSGDKFGPNALRRFQSHLVATGRFARTTVNAHVNRVRRFVKWCQSRELVPRGASEELATVAGLRRGKTSARESEPVVAVPWAVWRATLPFLAPQVRAMVQVQYWCGMRPGEVCILSAAEIDRTQPVWFFRPADHKTAHYGVGLTKAIPKPAQAILAPWLVGPPDLPCFRTNKGKPFNSDLLGEYVRRGTRAAMRARVPVVMWHPNQLRHAILSEIRDLFGGEGGGIEAAQLWAGHTKPDTTAGYTKQVEAALIRIAAALERRAS